MTQRTLLVVAIAMACGAGAARAQVPVADFFSTTSFVDGQPLPAGTTIEAWDADGVRCGTAVANTSGGFLIHVYGDDPMTSTLDEGASEGEMLEWRVAGVPVRPLDAQWIANTIGAFADLRWENGAAKQIQLDVRTTEITTDSWGGMKSRYRR